MPTDRISCHVTEGALPFSEGTLHWYPTMFFLGDVPVMTLLLQA